MIRTTPFHERTSGAQRDPAVEPLVAATWPPTATRCPTSSSTSRSATRPGSSTRARSSSTGSPARTPRRSSPASSPATSAPARRATPSTRAGSTTAASSSRTGSSSDPGKDEFLLTSRRAELRLLRGPHRPAWTSRSRRSATSIGTLALQGPRSRDLLAQLVPQMRAHPLLRGREGRDRRRGGDRQPDRLQRRPRLRDLDRQPDALHVWDTLWDSDRGPRRPAVRARRAVHAPHRGRPAAARRRLRLQPVRLERRASIDADRARLGAGCSRTSTTDDRAFIGRKALEREIADKTSRWAMRGLVVDWQDYDRVYNEAGLIPPEGPRAGRRGLDASTTTTTSGSATPPASCTRRCSSATSRSPACARPREARDQGQPRVHRRPPLRAGRRARRPAAALQPGAKDGLT